MTAASPAHFLQLNDPAFNYCPLVIHLYTGKKDKAVRGLILGLSGEHLRHKGVVALAKRAVLSGDSPPRILQSGLF